MKNKMVIIVGEGESADALNKALEHRKDDVNVVVIGKDDSITDVVEELERGIKIVIIGDTFNNEPDEKTVDDITKILHSNPKPLSEIMNKIKPNILPELTQPLYHKDVNYKNGKELRRNRRKNKM